MKLLVVKLSSMGDIIHAFPAVSEAMVKRPDLQIDWCVDSSFVELVRLHPAIRTIHANDVTTHRFVLPDRHTWRRMIKLRADLRRSDYDLVIDAQGLIRSAAIARLARAPVAGYDIPSVRELPAALAYRHRFPVARGEHAVTRIRRLFAAALGYEIDTRSPPDSSLQLRAASRENSVFFLHGTTALSKQWPTAHWIGLAVAAAALGLTPVVTWSNDNERAVAEAIKHAVPATRVIPKSPLGQITAEIGRARVVVGVDTGLAHLADAAGLPTVMIFQASNPSLTGPSGRLSEALPPPGGITARPRRRTAHLPVDPSQIVPLDTVVAAMTRIAERVA